MQVKTETIQAGPRRGESVFTPYRNGRLAKGPLLWMSASRAKHFDNTRKSVLTTIGLIDAWAEYFDIDYEDKCMWGEGLSAEELESLRYYLDFRAEDLARLGRQKRSGVHIIDKTKLLKTFETVKPATVAARLWAAQEYLTFLVEYGTGVLVTRCVVPDELIERRRLLATKVRREATSRGKMKIIPAPPGSIAAALEVPRRGNRQKGSPTDMDEINRFAEWLLIDHIPEKTWGKKTRANRRVCLRNQAIIMLSLHTGLRRGEILQLKSKDIDQRKRAVKVVRRHSDADDPRPRKPVAKTNARKLPIDENVFRLVREWIVERKEIMVEVDELGRNFNDYLFVNVARDPSIFGNPMSDRAIQKIMDETTKAAGIKIRFHDLRHKAISKLAEVASALLQNSPADGSHSAALA